MSNSSKRNVIDDFGEASGKERTFEGRPLRNVFGGVSRKVSPGESGRDTCEVGGVVLLRRSLTCIGERNT